MTCAPDITPQQLDILRHALGYNYEPRQVRNWIGVDPGSADHATVLELVAAGLMIERGDVSFSTSRSYTVIKAGHEAVRRALPKPRPMTRSQRRYDRYLDIREVCPDLTFIEFCKHEKEYR